MGYEHFYEACVPAVVTLYCCRLNRLEEVLAL